MRYAESNPAFDTVERLAHNLGVSLFELLGVREEDMRSSAKNFGYDFDTIANSAKMRTAGREPLDKALGSKR